MRPPGIDAAFRHWAGEVACWSARLGRTVAPSPSLLQRTPHPPPYRHGRRSANGQCRLLRARDHWIAFNLPRAEDLEMVPALLGEPIVGDPWVALEGAVAASDASPLLEQAHRLGLAATRLGETQAGASRPCGADGPQLAGTASWRGPQPPRVLDLSALWAGPLASALLARAGCDVLRVDGRAEPDGFGRVERPGIGRLDAGKRSEHFALHDAAGRARLRRLLVISDVVITGMRRRAADALGIAEAVAAPRERPLLWLAITAHGIDGPGADRVGFGDDCAVAGGLVGFAADGSPTFLGDAIADPLTGLRAAASCLRALVRGETGVLDIALAATAADALARSGVAAREPLVPAASGALC